MTVMYATAAELASYLQKDVDTSTAELNLKTASALFKTRAATAFTATSETWTDVACGAGSIRLPFRLVTAVAAVRIVTAQAVSTTLPPTSYRLIKGVLYRAAGFGAAGAFPPDAVEVDLTYGMAAVPDDVKGAVLETAASAYQSPDATVVAEQIDDYQIRYGQNTGGLMLTASAARLADLYRGTFAA